MWVLRIRLRSCACASTLPTESHFQFPTIHFDWERRVFKAQQGAIPYVVALLFPCWPWVCSLWKPGMAGIMVNSLVHQGRYCHSLLPAGSRSSGKSPCQMGIRYPRFLMIRLLFISASSLNCMWTLHGISFARLKSLGHWMIIVSYLSSYGLVTSYEWSFFFFCLSRTANQGSKDLGEK